MEILLITYRAEPNDQAIARFQAWRSKIAGRTENSATKLLVRGFASVEHDNPRAPDGNDAHNGARECERVRRRQLHLVCEDALGDGDGMLRKKLLRGLARVSVAAVKLPEVTAHDWLSRCSWRPARRSSHHAIPIPITMAATAGVNSAPGD